MENNSVVVSQVKNWVIVGPVVGAIIIVVGWPLVIVKLEAEDLTSQDPRHLHPFFYKLYEIFVE
jgi:hypothetical protein